MFRDTRTVVGTALLAMVASAALLAQQFDYPKTRTVEHVDTYGGVTVADPYRWLEDDTSAETAAWVEAQNKLTFGYLDTDSIPQVAHGAGDCAQQLREGVGAVAQGPLRVLQPQRRPAEPERPLHPERHVEGRRKS